eukprot:m.70236 g.70236  ORF g.70236 m.70236 type:complete len:61 (+) comp10003_c0_seq1:400-582(+)
MLKERLLFFPFCFLPSSAARADYITLWSDLTVTLQNTHVMGSHTTKDHDGDDQNLDGKHD